MDNRYKITLDSFSAKRLDGIITDQFMELTDHHMEVVAEAIMQVLYNVSLNTNIELNYDLRIKDGASFFVHGADVTVLPNGADSYRRRIRNSSNVMKK